MSIWLLLYRMKKITAAQIWERVDSGAISVSPMGTSLVP